MVDIVGISTHHPDAAVAAVREGRLIAAVEEERFRRIKHWAGYPELALRWAVEELGGEASSVTAFAVARQPRAYAARKVALALRNPGSLRRALGRARNLAEVGTVESRLRETFALDGVRVIAVEHHLAHLASAFFPSPFQEAACLSVDGFGDFVSTMTGRGRGSSIEVLDRICFPHSLGIFYSAMTQFLGFPNFGDEYKVMGLAAYGEPTLAHKVGTLVPAGNSGDFRLDLRYFRHLSEGVELTWPEGVPVQGDLFTPRLEELLGPRRRPADVLTQRHKDLAASMQRVFEERYFELVRRALRLAGSRNLALAGGCALNSLANGRLFENADVDEVWIQPAAGDAGTSLGAALWATYDSLGVRRAEWVQEHSAWGPMHAEPAVRSALADAVPGSGGSDGAYGELHIETSRDDETVCSSTAKAIAAGEVVGWFQGRSEWGPRALGSRSIVADPRRADMKEILNVKIKRRESFRPFAPSILEERTSEWFTISHPDPFMLKVYPIRPEMRERIPAVVHVDGSGRLQTVSDRSNPMYARLIRAFERETGVPIVLNTSFNENEPIVNTPGEAIACFLRTRMDRLVLGRTTVRREPA